jgi:hypothetical protein
VIAAKTRGPETLCGTAITLRSSTEVPTLGASDVIVVSQRVVRRGDSDSPGLYAIHDQGGALLYATVMGERLDRFKEDFGDLFPDLVVTSSDRKICTALDIGEQLASVRLGEGKSSCEIDSHSQGCCELWGRTYEVQILNAFAPNPGRSWTTVGMTLRTRGLFKSAEEIQGSLR